MAALRSWTGVLALAAASAQAAPTVAPQTSPWAPLIDEASHRFGVPSSWIARVMTAESDGHTFLAGRPIRSRAGAIGLMQLMPGTWADMRDAQHLGTNPDDPHDNIIAGTAYLRLMFDRFGYPGLFAAYNAGPERYASAIATGQRLPNETLAYLAAVTGATATVPELRRRDAMQSLFVLRHDQGGGIRPHATAPSGGLFVAGGVVTPGP